MSVLLDTGCIFALLNTRDANHDAAGPLFDEIASRRWGRPAISDLVLAEVFTLIRAKTRSAALERKAAALLGLARPGLPDLRTVSLAPHEIARTWEAFEKFRDRDLSFTDASNLVLLEAHAFDHLATFDRGFQGLVKTLPK